MFVTFDNDEYWILQARIRRVPPKLAKAYIIEHLVYKGVKLLINFFNIF